jgi:hypothetical protein
MTRVILIGAGKGGKALLDLLHEDPTVQVVGVADVDGQAVGLVRARELGLPVTTDFGELLKGNSADLIIDVIGDPKVGREIFSQKSKHTEVIGPSGARFFWEFVEAKNQTKALQDKYHLVLRELHAFSEGEFIIGNNPKMKEISQLIAKVAPTPTTVLIRGESETRSLSKDLSGIGSNRRSHSTSCTMPVIRLFLMRSGRFRYFFFFSTM